MSSNWAGNEQVIEQFRASGGAPFGNTSMLLVTTTGAKSGLPRTTPLLHSSDGDRIVIVASKGGEPTEPDWYRNLVANPVVTVELGAATFQARAKVVGREERDRLYAHHAELYPQFVEYEQKTTRVIPVVVLERLS